MQNMYSAAINSPSTEVLLEIDDSATIISVRDIAAIPAAPNLLTLGYDTENPETILLVSIDGDEITVERAFEGDASSWGVNTKIARIFNAYDYEAFRQNILELASGTGGFITTNKFIDSEYIYFVGDIVAGWRVNRYNIDNVLTTASDVVNKPTNLAECQALTYI